MVKIIPDFHSNSNIRVQAVQASHVDSITLGQIVAHTVKPKPTDKSLVPIQNHT